jgi:hypothetical protein
MLSCNLVALTVHLLGLTSQKSAKKNNQLGHKYTHQTQLATHHERSNTYSRTGTHACRHDDAHARTNQQGLACRIHLGRKTPGADAKA